MNRWIYVSLCAFIVAGGALRALVSSLEYQGAEIDLGDVDQPYAAALLTFSVWYVTAADDPESTGG